PRVVSPPRLLRFLHAAPSAIYPLPLHDALPIFQSATTRSAAAHSPAAMRSPEESASCCRSTCMFPAIHLLPPYSSAICSRSWIRSEEHTSELQSRENLVCRLLLEKKKRTNPLSW